MIFENLMSHKELENSVSGICLERTNHSQHVKTLVQKAIKSSR